MNVFYEWRKLIICIILFMLLLGLQHFTGSNFSGPIGSLIDYSLVLLGIGALKNSILSTTERKSIRKNIPVKPEYEYKDPLIEDPWKK